MKRANSRRLGILLGVLPAVFLIIIGCGGEGDLSPSTQSPSFEPEDVSEESSVEGMNLGEVQFLDFGSSERLDLTFEGNAASATYWAIVNSNNIQEGSFSLVLQDSVSAPAVSEITTSGLIAQPALLVEETDDNPMHELARAWGQVYAEDPDMNVVQHNTMMLQAASVGPQLGQPQKFNVLNSLSSSTSHEAVEGRLRYMSDDLLIYVDVALDNSNDLTDEDIAELAAGFEENAISLERDLFGQESDVNNDDHITILMTPVLNRMCISSGIVTGFFFPGDLFENNSSNPASNEQEIFFTLVPDPTGQYCRALGVEFTMQNILSGVLAHEFQHMISFNQHVLVNGGATEEPWLNEGLAHLAEGLTGYGQENPSRMKLFLDQASTTMLIPSGLPSLSERGMAYMFMRYLYEQADDSAAFMNQLFDTDKTGVGNIEAAMNGLDSTFDEFKEYFANWQVALVLSDTGLTDNPRFTYEERTVHPQTGNPVGACVRCQGLDARKTVLTGPAMMTVDAFPATLDVESTSAQFFQIEQPGSKFSLSGSSGAKFGGALITLENGS